MSGKALAWATAVWEQQLAIFFSLEEFVVEVKKVFDAPLSRREAARKLHQLQQESRSVADYTVDFRTLAAESAWNTKALFVVFLHGQSEEVKTELAAWELPMDFDSSSPRPSGSMGDYGNEGERGDLIALAHPRIPNCL